MPRRYDEVDLTMADLEAMAKKCSNWGKWGPDDEIGTLNYIGPEELKYAGSLVRQGKSISLGLDFNQNGPQTGRFRRFNPVHSMLATGADACAAAQGVEIRRGDIVVVRTGHMERCLAKQDWTGYSGGDSPGMAFETAEWAFGKEIAALCTDTWGCEVRPNEIAEAFQPWHWVVIPMMGLTLGEIFYLKDIGEDCAGDGVYDFLFCAPPLPITGAVGSPINPIALK